MSAFGYQLLPVAALFGAVRSSGVVGIDMRTDYRDVVSQVFPRAVHHQCIFHALQEVREQAKEAYGTNYAETCPEVERLLDEIDAIFDARTKRTAQRRYEKVLAQRHHFEADNPAASAIFDFLER